MKSFKRSKSSDVTTPHQPYSIELKHLKEPGYFSAIAYMYLAFALPYLIWRTTIINWGVWYGPLAYLADFYGVLTTGLFVIIARRIDLPLRRATNLRKTVDIFIPTYNEPLNVVEPTVLGAIGVVGHNDIFVLDDGNRPEFRRMAERLGVRYYPRTTNQHAKAGNLNNGLAHSKAEFIMTLDADHIPLPNFLENTLGYFDDKNLAFVQTPQSFYNQDSFLFRRKKGHTWAEQGMFYDTIQPAKNRWNSAFFVGTSAVLRRASLDNVGGFATGTATEDIHTSLKLHAKGWKSLFLPVPLAYGLESESLNEYYKQRRRWAAGSLGLLFRSPDSPLRAKGLSIGQRLNYLSACLAHLQGLQKLWYFVLPIICSFALVSPVTTSLLVFGVIFGTYLLLALGVTAIYSRGTYHPLYTEAYNLAVSWSHIGGLRGIIKVQRKFAVSRKTARRNEQTWVKMALWGLAVISIVAIARLTLLVIFGNHSAVVIASLIFIDINYLALSVFLLPLRRYEHSSRNQDAMPPLLRYQDIRNKFGEPTDVLVTSLREQVGERAK